MDTLSCCIQYCNTILKYCIEIQSYFVFVPVFARIIFFLLQKSCKSPQHNFTSFLKLNKLIKLCCGDLHQKSQYLAFSRFFFGKAFSHFFKFYTFFTKSKNTDTKTLNIFVAVGLIFYPYYFF